MYKLSQPRKSFFIIWSHVVSQKNYTCWNKHGEEDLNELEVGCPNEGEVRHHATDSQLKRWFATRKEAQLFLWHDEGRKELKKDGKFRHPADAAQWGNINNHSMV
jgi:hypothetical protein